MRTQHHLGIYVFHILIWLRLLQQDDSSCVSNVGYRTLSYLFFCRHVRVQAIPLCYLFPCFGMFLLVFDVCLLSAMLASRSVVKIMHCEKTSTQMHKQVVTHILLLPPQVSSFAIGLYFSSLATSAFSLSTALNLGCLQLVWHYGVGSALLLSLPYPVWNCLFLYVCVCMYVLL